MGAAMEKTGKELHTKDKEVRMVTRMLSELKTTQCGGYTGRWQAIYNRDGGNTSRAPCSFTGG